MSLLHSALLHWRRWTPERFPRLARGKHAGLALAVCLVAFCTYRVTAVPLIEPPHQERKKDSNLAADPNLPAREEQKRRLEIYFSAGDWELDQAKVLEAAQGMLIFKDYKTLADGQVELSPCTVLMLPEGTDALSDEEKARRAVYMRAPQGAVLQFEEFNIRMAKVGRLIGGRLNGEIVIHSQQRDPSPDDDLLIRTRNLIMAEKEIHTDAAVEFSLGQSSGSGRDMHLYLLADKTGGGNARGPSIGGIRSFQLKDDVRLHLAVETLKKPDDGAAAAAEKEPEPPIEITSRGPFEFDMQTYVASFRDHVDVLRIVPNGPSDQLLCESLFVHFTPKTDANGAPLPQQPGKLPKLEPGWIRAFGSPVVINAPSSKVKAQGEELAYDLRNRSGALKALRPGEQVKVLQEMNEIHARELHFSPGATKADLGKFVAIGPGWLKGTMPEDPTSPIEARWSKDARLQPDGTDNVLSVTGRAFIRSEASGSLAADGIHVWLRPAEPLPDGKKGRPTPRKMLAKGSVEFSSPQIDGHVQELIAYFEKPPSGAAPSAPGATETAQGPIQPSIYLQAARKVDPAAAYQPLPPVAPPAGPAPGLLPGGKSDEPPAQKFDVKGEHLRLSVVLEEPKARLAGLVIEQNVVIVEIPLIATDDKPLKLYGDRVDLDQAIAQQAEVKVFGRPAHVEARGMAMNSAQINLSQADNRMWTTGAGEMDLLVDRDMEGKELKTPKPLKVTWAGNMEFNGEEARFRDGVETRFSETVGAKQEQQSLDTNELVVVMEKKLDFQQGMAKGTGPKRETPKVAQLRCNGAVTLLQYLYDGNKLTASRELHTRAMRIDQLTGNIDAPGPGTVMSAQMGGENPLLTTSTAATPPPAVAPPKADPEKETINFLRVDFRERISGNMKTKELTFHEQVKAIYGPVPDFRTRLDTLNPDLTDEDRFLLTTDELTVRQVSRPNLPASMELETGLGDTTIEGQKFEAWASRLTYDQSKELITLYGDGLTEAWISHVARVGELRKQTQAGTIQYSKKNQTVTVGNFRHLDLSGMSQPKK